MQALRRWTAMVAALALAAGGCNSGGGDSPPAQVPQVTLKTERVFPNLSFTMPVAMLQAPQSTSRWFVVEQGGVVWTFQNDNNVTQAQRTKFIDISARVTSGGELGLLGMAFHPDFPTDPRVYLYYSRTVGNLLETRISVFRSADGGLTLDPTDANEQPLIRIPQPETNHNGGNLAFGVGPDRLHLFAGIGDGGGANDQHGPIGNAQKTSTLLGKMLRIRITPTGYSIPSDNPFVAQAGQPCSIDDAINRTQPCPEIFALGFRNPFRGSFDRLTGQLWVGDVGQFSVEEVDRVDLNGNYGWRCFEGTASTGFACGSLGPRLPPVAQYGRSVGSTVIGGYVYRGSAHAGLVGRYIFGDFGSRLIFSIDATAQPVLEMTTGFASGLQISSFAEDVNGELFVVNYEGNLHRITQ